MTVHFETVAIRERATADKTLREEDRAAIIENAPTMAREIATKTQQLFKREHEHAQRKLGAALSLKNRQAKKAARDQSAKALAITGKAPKEIAAILNVSEATVSRARGSKKAKK